MKTLYVELTGAWASLSGRAKQKDIILLLVGDKSIAEHIVKVINMIKAELLIIEQSEVRWEMIMHIYQIFAKNSRILAP